MVKGIIHKKNNCKRNHAQKEHLQKESSTKRTSAKGIIQKRAFSKEGSLHICKMNLPQNLYSKRNLPQKNIIENDNTKEHLQWIILTKNIFKGIIQKGHLQRNRLVSSIKF
ncbi:hypothetical protein AVEN_182220-1 [Araneus ventricosus]|uniref:Uncharacterized protein n=1 Tax=Araneus ventricosus TaxID=182803 RepID=A0A4Y2UPR5_ARAVE|nr:hypothetical protein AVEN_182220-1 [Araneus ventricosus]